MDDLQKWLKINIPVEERAPCLVHGDWRIDNLIYKNGSFHLVAVIPVAFLKLLKVWVGI